MKRILFLLAPFALSACQPSLVWVKSGGSQNEYSQNRYECLKQAQQRESGSYAFKDASMSDSTVVTNKELFDACMNAKGWYLKRKDETRTQPTPESAEKVNNHNTRNKQINDEETFACAFLEYQMIYKKSPCRIDSIAAYHIANDDKITEDEKKVFLEIYTEDKQRSLRRAASYREVGRPSLRAVSELLDIRTESIAKSSTELYEGRISWGEFNKRRRDAEVTYRDNLKRAAAQSY